MVNFKWMKNKLRKWLQILSNQRLTHTLSIMSGVSSLKTSSNRRWLISYSVHNSMVFFNSQLFSLQTWKASSYKFQTDKASQINLLRINIGHQLPSTRPSSNRLRNISILKTQMMKRMPIWNCWKRPSSMWLQMLPTSEDRLTKSSWLLRVSLTALTLKKVLTAGTSKSV